MDNSLDFKKGRKSERDFKKYLEGKTDYKITFSSQEDDIEKHIDLYIEDPNHNVFGSGKETVGVDVKSKKMRKMDSDMDMNVEIRGHTVEFKNIKGNNGWLLGEADFIVFETVFYWLVLDRSKLFEFAYRITDFSNPTQSSAKMYGRAYQRSRWGHKDIITKVNCLDLMYLADVIYPKKRKIFN